MQGNTGQVPQIAGSRKIRRVLQAILLAAITAAEVVLILVGANLDWGTPIWVYLCVYGALWVLLMLNVRVINHPPTKLKQ